MAGVGVDSPFLCHLQKFVFTLVALGEKKVKRDASTNVTNVTKDFRLGGGGGYVKETNKDRMFLQIFPDLYGIS